MEMTIQELINLLRDARKVYGSRQKIRVPVELAGLAKAIKPAAKKAA